MRLETLAGLNVRIAGGLDRRGSGTGPLVVLLHGFGAPGTDLVGLFRELHVPAYVRFAFPEAPLSLGPAFSGGRAWWHLEMAELQEVMLTRSYSRLRESVPQGLEAAHQKLVAHLGELQTLLGCPEGQLILGGFSQGAMLATDVALTSSFPLAGLVILSGCFIRRAEWERLAPQREGLPVLASHGRADPILPYALAEELKELLLAARLKVDFLATNAGHGITSATLSALEAFINKHAPPPAV
jgi:phospholipase/carboxylesterase